MRPNIFELSPKELTQDGFITWLLNWADPSNKEYNQELNICATNFIKFLLKKQFGDIKIETVNVKRQWKNIDICADINEKYLIIIEDKIFTKEHSGQLERYKKSAAEWEEGPREPIFIYLKTGTESKLSLENVQSKGFEIIQRSDLIEFFSEYNGKIKNDIYNDFIEKINKIEKGEKEFDKIKIAEWSWGCWIGFYHFLDHQLENPGWDYVSNPSGGFLGLYWHFKKFEDYAVYPQIEQGNLCIKIGMVEQKEKRREAREKWYSIVNNQKEKEEKNEIKKPPRFGNGKYMTVAFIERKDWLGSDEDTIDKEKVVERLKEYEKFIDRCLETSD
jgi:hypothetical protein